MFCARINCIFLLCVIFACFHSGESRSNSDVTYLCDFKTDELIAHYGYKPEIHTVTTKDGYILTVFRCNSRRHSSRKKKAVILQHGILSTSDEFCANVPDQALAYVLADAGYDVWLPNARGTVYSRDHKSKDPEDVDFWNFSFPDIGMFDLSATIDYVREETEQRKVFFVAHSQGASCLLALLSEKPEYNRRIAAASLMAPIGYLGNAGHLLQILSDISPGLKQNSRLEYTPQEGSKDLFKTICSKGSNNLCSTATNILFGPSKNQRNMTMMPALSCHISSGASAKEIIHFGQEIKHGFFGKFMKGSRVPPDFELEEISTPMTLHYSTTDRFTNQDDVDKLVSKLKHTLVKVQEIDEKAFNHMDFVWGMHSATKIYSKIIDFFDSQ